MSIWGKMKGPGSGRACAGADLAPEGLVAAVYGGVRRPGRALRVNVVAGVSGPLGRRAIVVHVRAGGAEMRVLGWQRAGR